MKSHRNLSLLSILLVAAALLFLTACGTFELGVVHTPTPDLAATATVSALATENARLSAQATALAATSLPTLTPAPPTATPGLGTVTGRICFPSERIPVMTAYFQNTATNRVTPMPIGENQPSYGFDLPPGEYIAYAWLPDFAMGGLYSEMVRCGGGADCTDHTPVAFEVEPARATNGIDLCDWYLRPSQVPIPPGVERPGSHAPAEGG